MKEKWIFLICNFNILSGFPNYYILLHFITSRFIWATHGMRINFIFTALGSMHADVFLDLFNSFMTVAVIIETRPLICSANQWTGFYMITASVMKELNFLSVNFIRTSCEHPRIYTGNKIALSDSIVSRS